MPSVEKARNEHVGVVVSTVGEGEEGGLSCGCGEGGSSIVAGWPRGRDGVFVGGTCLRTIQYNG